MTIGIKAYAGRLKGGLSPLIFALWLGVALCAAAPAFCAAGSAGRAPEAAAASVEATAGVPDAEWYDAARNPANFEKLLAEITEWKLVGGYDDLTPLAMSLDRLARSESHPEAALALAKLAAAAAPSDPAVNYYLMRIGAANMDAATVATAFLGWIISWATDPWSQLGTALKVALTLGLAGLAATLALLFSLWPYYAPSLGHDISDKYPLRFKKFSPIGGTLLVLATIIAMGGGLAALLVVVSVAFMAYMPWRLRMVLALTLTLFISIFPTLDAIEKTCTDGGERAWLLYRVYKGESDLDAAERIERLYGERDVKALVARAFVERRNGRWDEALALLGAAERAGGDRALILGYTGPIKFMKGDLDGAVADLAEATSLDGSDWLGWYNLSTVYTFRLDLTSANAARARARELSPEQMEHYQNLTADVGAKIYPAFRNFPKRWVYQEMLGSDGGMQGWSRTIWYKLGVAHEFFHPAYLVLLLLLGLLYSKIVSRERLSRRCISCGRVKCPQCHRIVKEANICGGCYALTHEGDLDNDSRRRMREEITYWSRRTKSAKRVGLMLLPGWNAYVYQSGSGNFFLGAVWALALGVWGMMSFAYFPVGTWVWRPVIWVAPVLVVLIHAVGILRARKK